MFNLGLLLIPVLAGYWFSTRYFGTKYGIVRKSGYALFLDSAVAGLALLFVSFVSTYLLYYFVLKAGFSECPPLYDLTGLHSFRENVLCASYMSLIMDLSSITTPIYAAFGVALSNKFVSGDKAAEKAARTHGDFVELVLRQAINENKMVEVSLRSGKVYVGYVAEAEILATSRDVDISVIPIASGFRDQTTGRMLLQYDYADMYEEWGQGTGWSFRDAKIGIPRSELVSIRLFNPDFYVHAES